MPRPVLIDLYYTLIEPAADLHWFNSSADLLGVSPAELRRASMPSFNDRMIGAITTPEEVIDRALTELGRSDVERELYDQLVAKRWEFFHGVQAYPDALPTLAALRERGHQLALVTNCSAETTTVIERLGLEQFFDVLALSCDVGAAKPDPAIYEHAIGVLGIDPVEAVYVGDGDTDEHAGAARFGMTTVLLQRPGARLRDVRTDYVIETLTDLLTLPIIAGG